MEIISPFGNGWTGRVTASVAAGVILLIIGVAARDFFVSQAKAFAITLALLIQPIVLFFLQPIALPLTVWIFLAIVLVSLTIGTLYLLSMAQTAEAAPSRTQERVPVGAWVKINKAVAYHVVDGVYSDTGLLGKGPYCAKCRAQANHDYSDPWNVYRCQGLDCGVALVLPHQHDDLQRRAEATVAAQMSRLKGDGKQPYLDRARWFTPEPKPTGRAG